MLQDPVTLGIAGLASVLAVIITITLIICHLRNYTEPVFQRYIVRIVFMVPFYGVSSFFSLLYRQSSIYFDTLRDCYEAWVIYNFMSLCLAYVGGPGAVVIQAEGKLIMPSWTWGTCCLPPTPVDGFLLRRCKQATLQFVLIKPVLAILTLVLYSCGKYEDGDWSPEGGYLYITILYNVCYTVALYGLLVFYLGTEELLKPYKPLMKFILVKSIIFLTFWQGMAISMVANWASMSTSDQQALQDWIVCLEMFCSSIMMWIAFPYTDYKIGGQSVGLRAGAVKHALSIRDVVVDTLTNFSSTYHDYVLYSDGGPADHVKRKQFRQGKAKKPGLEEIVEEQPQRAPKPPRSVTMDKSSTDGILSSQQDDGFSSIPGTGKGKGTEKRSPGAGKGKGAKKRFRLGRKGSSRITDGERRQAELLDSESDGSLVSDGDDNQLDHSSDDSSKGPTAPEETEAAVVDQAAATKPPIPPKVTLKPTSLQGNIEIKVPKSTKPKGAIKPTGSAGSLDCIATGIPSLSVKGNQERLGFSTELSSAANQPALESVVGKEAPLDGAQASPNSAPAWQAFGTEAQPEGTHS